MTNEQMTMTLRELEIRIEDRVFGGEVMMVAVRPDGRIAMTTDTDVNIDDTLECSVIDAEDEINWFSSARELAEAAGLVR